MRLFEAIRRDHFLRGLSIRALAKTHGVHRRAVRQAIASAVPPARRPTVRDPKVLTTDLRDSVDAWLESDRTAPRKQRHTARRIFKRLQEEHDFTGAESTVRHYVGQRRREIGLGKEAFIPRDHQPGEEAEVDWYEAEVDFPDGRRKVQLFRMRACYSGREFHMAFPNLTQQALLEAHVAVFEYFGGVFPIIRYDNLKSAVEKVKSQDVV